MDVKLLVTTARERLVSGWERAGVPFLVAGVAVTASLMTSLLVVLTWQGRLQESDQGRMDRYGEALSAQLAALAVEPLIAGDRIRLGVLAQRMVEFPEIVTVSVHTIDDRVVATAGEPQSHSLQLYTYPIGFEETLAGHVRLTVDPAAFHAPGALQLWLPALLMLLASGGLGYALGQHIESRTTPVPRPTTRMRETIEPLPSQRTIDNYLLVVNLFNQAAVAAETRNDVLAYVQHRTQLVAALYRGECTDLPGTGLLVVFREPQEMDRCFRVICAALLCADMLEELNDGEYCDLSPRLVFRYGVHVVPSRAFPTDSTEWRDTEAVADTMLLSAVAPNGSVALSGDAFTRLESPQRCQWRPYRNPILNTLATGNGAGCVLVSDLIDDYRALLDNEAELLLAQPDSTDNPSTL
jgi:hypothetical protein